MADNHDHKLFRRQLLGVLGLAVILFVIWLYSVSTSPLTVKPGVDKINPNGNPSHSPANTLPQPLEKNAIVTGPITDPSPQQPAAAIPPPQLAQDEKVNQFRLELLEALEKKDHHALWNTIAQLQRLRVTNASAVDELHKLLREPKPDFVLTSEGFFKSHVINALAQMGPNAIKAIPDMLPLVSNKSCHGSLAIALGKLGRDRADVEQGLLELVKSPESWARCQAAYSLGKIGVGSETAIKALRKISVDDPDEQVRDGARKALLLLGKKDSVKPPEPPRDF